ncbi:MAG: DUF2723 domain-containing protein [Chloroflexi bacterium]|nr:MAG: DUF2723 domain-containing protein [Chloroflexota bacterium]
MNRSQLYNAAAPAVLGGAYGAGLARALLEYDTARFGALGELWAVAALVLAGALLVPLGWRMADQWLLRATRTQAGETDVTAAAWTQLPLLLGALNAVLPDVVPLRGVSLAGGGAALALAARAALLLYQLQRAHWLQRAAPFALALLAGTLYWRTLAPAVGPADTFEFQVNVLRLGISHGSGYPLYILLAKLFSWLPVGGTAAYRINLSAAAFGAGAVAVAYGVARRMGARTGAAGLAALALATAPAFWQRAVEAEVYTLHVLLFGTLLGLLLALPAGAAGAPQLRWFFLLFGLALANHLTTGVLLPALLAALWLQSRRAVAARVWLQCAALLLLGLCVYLYLPLRWPALNHGEVLSLQQFLQFFTGAEAHGALRPLQAITEPGRYWIVGRKALDQYGWAGALLAAVGLASYLRHNLRGAIITMLAWGGTAAFALSFYVPDPDYSSFLLPAHFVQALWMALGVTALLRAPAWAAWPQLALAAFALLPLSGFWRNFSAVDQSADWRADQQARSTLALPLRQGAAILADSERMPPLFYLQVAEHRRPDLDISVLPDEAAYRSDLAARLARGQAVYLARYLPNLAAEYLLQSVGGLVEVDAQLPPAPAAFAAQFGDAVRLHTALLAGQPAAGSALGVTLQWSALQPVDGSYLVNFRLLDAVGEERQSWPGTVPVGRMYPTNAWRPGVLIADWHALLLDAALPGGQYVLQAALLPAFGSAGLAVNGGGNWAPVAALQVQRAAQPMVPAVAALQHYAPGVWLRGFDAPASVLPGAPFDVLLHWTQPAPQAGTAAVEFVAGSAAPVRVNLAAHGAAQNLTTRTQLRAPAAAGAFTLALQAPPGGASCGWLQWPRGQCVLATLQVTARGARSGVVNFDGQLLLEEFAVLTPRVQRGAEVRIAAQWYALRQPAADYTEFVHLLGPDGLVHGQVDTWPVQGTRPTSSWLAGSTVAEELVVRVPADAPPGAYKVEAGWYLLETLQRLPVLDATGATIDDKLLTGSVQVVP